MNAGEREGPPSAGRVGIVKSSQSQPPRRANCKVCVPVTGEVDVRTARRIRAGRVRH